LASHSRSGRQYRDRKTPPDEAISLFAPVEMVFFRNPRGIDNRRVFVAMRAKSQPDFKKLFFPHCGQMINR